MSASPHCYQCPLLVESRTKIVDGAGSLRSPLMIVGEAPGADEDHSGIPFVGASGKILRSTLAEFAPQKNIFLTNSVRCRPEKNRDPLKEELANCEMWLIEEIVKIKPKVILAVGKIARYQVTWAMTHLREMYADEDWPMAIHVHFSFHPAYVKRFPGKRDEFVRDVREAIETAFGTYESKEIIPEPYTILHEMDTRYIYPARRFMGVDTETDDLEEGIGTKRVGWSISDGKVAIFTTEDPEQYIRHIPFLYLHNAKYDIPHLGMDPNDLTKWDDTQLMAYVLRYTRVGLKLIGPEKTGIPMDPISTIIGTGKKRIPFSQALVEQPKEARDYAAKDALVTSRLASILLEELRNEPKLWNYYQTYEKPLVPILLRMEQRGVLIDRQALSVAGDHIKTERDKLREELCESLGIENPRSLQPLAQALASCGFLFPRLTPTGAIAIDKEAILAAGGVDKEDDLPEHSILLTLLQYRSMDKLYGTYITGITERLDQEGALHGRFNQAVTDTNRLSSSDPNLQNIPARTEVGASIRRAFIPRPRHRWVRGDYSQLELRLFAHYTREPLFLEAYPFNGEEKDIHQMTADRFARFGVKRKAAKNTNFAAIYGADEAKIATTAGVPPAQAHEFLRTMQEMIPSLLTWRPYIAGQLMTQGYVETLLGWRGYYPGFWSPIRKDQQAAIRAAANFPIQGTAAGIVKDLMISAEPLAAQYGARLLLQVHDELDYECPDETADEFSQELERLGAKVGLKHVDSVPLRLEVKQSENWRDAG